MPPTLSNHAIASAPYSGAVAALPEAGFYTGTFDPPTRAHLAIVENLVREQKLAKVIVVVNDAGSRKAYNCSVAERCAMFRASLPKDIAPFVEIRGEPEIGKNALFAQLAQQGRYSWHGVIGDDSYATLPADVKASRKWLVIDRNGVPPTDPGVRRITVGAASEGISSSKVRALLAQGLDAAGMLPEGAARLIRAHAFYAMPTGALLAVRERTFNALCALLAGVKAALSSDKPPFVPTQSVAAMRSYIVRYRQGRVG